MEGESSNCECLPRNIVSHTNLDLGIFCACRKNWKNEVRFFLSCVN